MVGRHSSLLVTKRSLRNSDSGSGKRPRRVVQTKNVDDTVGLSRREEQELNKALYASLQENRRSKALPGFGDGIGDYSSSNHISSSCVSSNNLSSCSSSTTSIGKGSIKGNRSLQEASSSTTTTSTISSSGGSRVCRPQKVVQTLKHSVLSGRVFPKRPSRHRELAANLSLDESSQDSVRSSASSHNGSKRKVHAQRKFAQGCSLPGMTSCTPVKFAAPAVKVLSSKMPKTEDFLTFLCLRGSSILPAHLDFFNFSLEEPPSCQEGSKSGSYADKNPRERTSDSSSTGSGPNDEVAEAASVTTPTMTRRSGGGSLARRSAARASAGTPETARGIVSLRQGLQRKVSTSSSSSSLTRFPVSSSCLLPASQLTNNTPCQYRNKFYFTPEKSPSPSKTSGIRPGEFTPPSLFSSTSHMSSTYKFSPLVCSPSKFSSTEQPFGSPASQSTSSRSSSLSSTSLCGASKRKRRITVPSRTATTKKSPLGAFTPVAASFRSPGRPVRSGSPGRVRRSDDLLDDSVGNIKSARKSLFGKPTSVVQQQARRIKEKSVASSGLRWKDRIRTKLIRSDDEDVDNKKRTLKSGRSERRKRKRPDDFVQEGSERRSINKRPKREAKRSRRSSTRLREMSRHAKGSNLYRRTNTADKANSMKTTDKDMSTSLAVGETDENPSTHSVKTERAERTSSGSATKPRKPYKIRPLERVRTRAYSLLQASKQALKKARRENAAVKHKAASSSHNRSSEDSRKRSEFDSRKSPVRTRTAAEKQQVTADKAVAPQVTADKAVTQQVTADKAVTSTGVDDPVRSALIQPRVEISPGSTCVISDKIHVARSSKVSKDGARSATRRPTPKKAKVQTSPSGVPSSQTAAEENSIPTFHPTEAEFSDPITYISQIQPLAGSYGMCRIIPPPSWKLDSNKISDDIRFTPQVQHVHRLYQRWGPNVQHSAAINHHLLSEMSNVTTTPQIGGIEIDLHQLYQLVEEAGGPKKMNDKKHWARIADIMNIPKQAMDRTMRLYDIYCRHVFPYATLSAEERKHLEDEVKAIHDLQTVEDDAVIRGKSMPVSWFNRIARNVQAMWFKEDATPSQIESRYWPVIEDKTKHVVVHCGHINTRTQASAFPTRRDSAYTRHPWNLNNVVENQQCVLKYLGPVSGVSIPTLHMNMLFSTSCWSADPHNLPYIQYLHTGAEIIWYCIPKSQHSRFRGAMTELVPSLVAHKQRWLKEDCVMVNPQLLRKKGLRIGRCIQSPRQFVVVFPGAFTSTISCGYSVAESVHFATSKWLPLGMEAALTLSKSGEKELFSMSALLCSLAQDENVDAATLTEALPLLSAIVSRELELRTQLHAAGIRGEKRAVFTESPVPGNLAHKKRLRAVDDEKVCDVCDKICYLSMVLNEQKEQVLCLEHGVRHVQRRKHLKSTRLFLRHNQTELEAMIKECRERLTRLTNSQDHTSTSQENKIRNNLK
ncbi:unnamed protein product [Candidula unifasciata]|uniref:Protein Jumonji n=1 Tax=Candidula unifasciata TaxID=100452 RepID=A0A8S4A2V8_9EUPU|nr:unnamed protein product [Candidula unifasciata]